MTIPKVVSVFSACVRYPAALRVDLASGRRIPTTLGTSSGSGSGSGSAAAAAFALAARFAACRASRSASALTVSASISALSFSRRSSSTCADSSALVVELPPPHATSPRAMTKMTRAPSNLNSLRLPYVACSGSLWERPDFRQRPKGALATFRRCAPHDDFRPADLRTNRLGRTSPPTSAQGDSEICSELGTSAHERPKSPRRFDCPPRVHRSARTGRSSVGGNHTASALELVSAANTRSGEA